MDQGTIIRIIILIILILLSAFFSSAETVFMAVNEVKIKSLCDEGNKKALLIQKILSNYSKLISGILVGNNIVNISASALTTTIAASTGYSMAVSIATGVLTFVILIFGEIVPKTIAKVNADKLVFIYAPFIQFVLIVLTPVIWIVDTFAKVILWILRIDTDKSTPMTESELRTIVDTSHEDGVIEDKEREMIVNVVDFGDAMVKDIMIPRIDMECVSDDATFNEIKEAFENSKFTRFPVYHESTDNIIGVINIKDMVFLKEEDFKISSILREVYFTYEHKKTSDLMMELRGSSLNIAMVLNEYGLTEGMVTMEDLLEEIVGEIRDEYDEDERDLIHKIDENKYIVQGSMKLDDINNAIGTEFESEEYDSIGGLIIEKLDTLPQVREKVILDDGTMLIVKKVKDNRIEEVVVNKKAAVG